MNEAKIIKFYLAYMRLMSQYYYLPNILEDVEELTLQHNMTKGEIKFILDNYDTTFDLANVLRDTHDDWVGENDETYVETVLIALSGAMSLQNIKNIDDKIRRIKEIIDEGN